MVTTPYPLSLMSEFPQQNDVLMLREYPLDAPLSAYESITSSLINLMVLLSIGL